MLGLVGQLRDLLNSRAMDVAVVDGNGDQLTGFDSSRPSVAVTTQVTVNNTVGGTVLLAVNTGRRKFQIWNGSGAKIFVGFEAAVSATDYAFEIPNNGFYESSLNDYTGEIRAFRTSGSGSVNVTEITT